MAHQPNNVNNHAVVRNHVHENGLLPQLETFERMMKLPVVEAAWHQGQDVYGKVKGKLSVIFFLLLVKNILLTR